MPDESLPPLNRNRDFLLLMLGQTGSLVGTSMTSLALVMLAYSVTGSTAQAGAVSAVYGVGMAAMMLPAGAVVDRVDRKRAMVVTAIAGAAALASIPVAAALADVTFAQLVIVAAVDGALACFYNPAEMAALKHVVPPAQMGSAMAMNQGRGAVAGLLGPPLAGLLFGVRRTLPFIADAATFLVAAACTALVRRPLPAPVRARRQHLLRDVRDGLGWLRRARAVRDLVLATMVSNIAFTGIATTVLLALQQDGTGPSQLGLLQASYGVAGIVGSLIATPVLGRVRVGAVVPVVFWLLVAFDLAMTISRSIWWLGGFVALTYLVVRPSNTAMSAYQVHVTPDEMLGRSEAAAGFGRVVMIPLGSAGAGILLEYMGRIPAMLIFAAAMAVAAGLATVSRPVIAIPRTTELHTLPTVP
ncbi:MAG TPA: MFS transporter [Mycobacteriales bacterium]|nr:MFS transporter [Mycobacteriales bacterium]